MKVKKIQLVHSISVIIPTFNRPYFMLQAVEEVLKQGHPAICEIIIIDQTPKDNYDQQIKNKLDSLLKNRLIKYIFKSNPSVTEAKNLGIKLATGSILLYLDDDILLPKNYIEEHFKCLQWKNVLAVTGEVYNRNNTASIEDLKVESPNLNTQKVFNQNFTIRHKRHLAGGNFSVFKAFALQIGGFDENFISLGEDPDFSYRLFAKFPDKLVVFNPDAYIIHLRAPFGGNRISGNKQVPEYKHLKGQFLLNLRYSKKSTLTILFENLRLGPFRKENVIKPWRQPYAWYSYVKAFLVAKINTSNIKNNLF